MKFDHTHYVPWLRWKQGEYQAIKKLSSEEKMKMTPIIELPEFGYDHEKNEDFKKMSKIEKKFLSFLN